ncbi:DUF1616 domain-containing protein [Methanosphaera cuniculi]|uniref:DUF1616 domain-containing protein n=1 Tax=Methanosphaera cuniculi TaxID=1077256 RepID=A0A2A2HD96_9EURY|nr:DUF1616 domain-containing protein [Methanosphaera cuniculi]PAV07392.1 hypothetical protein ASJ82_00685 [Methanosphaera cuniculi]PWL07973.1 hypothetical protein MSCUN_12160 [Methanosphaera cuniculi]
MKIVNKIIKAALIIILILAIVCVCYMVVNPNQGEGYTEFYILDHNNNTTDYPTNVSQYSIEKINIGIKNKENAKMNYTIVIKKDGYIQAMYNKTLQNDQEEITPYYLTSTSNIGDNQDLKIELYKGNTTSVYRTLKLKYNVV